MPRLHLLISIVGALIASTLLSGCAQLQTQQSAQKPNGIRLYVFNCGNIDAKDISLFSPHVNVGKNKQLTDTCFLIKHPKGNLLWGAGVADSLGAKGLDVYNHRLHMSVAQPFTGQLAKLGIKPEDIQYVAWPDFHPYNTGNANLFTHSTVLTQQEEFNAAYGTDPQKYHFDPTTYDKLNRAQFKILHGDYDVFGDGSVRILQAAGPTPGHQVLFVKLAHYGPVLLSGELYHFTASRLRHWVPAFNYNGIQTLNSMRKFDGFANAVQARLWIQYDLQIMGELKQAPQYYN